MDEIDENSQMSLAFGLFQNYWVSRADLADFAAYSRETGERRAIKYLPWQLSDLSVVETPHSEGRLTINTTAKTLKRRLILGIEALLQRGFPCNPTARIHVIPEHLWDTLIQVLYVYM